MATLERIKPVVLPIFILAAHSTPFQNGEAPEEKQENRLGLFTL
jgi:hypothetical protein